jgi:hypothetical protein
MSGIAQRSLVPFACRWIEIQSLSAFADVVRLKVATHVPGDRVPASEQKR